MDGLAWSKTRASVSAVEAAIGDLATGDKYGTALAGSSC